MARKGTFYGTSGRASCGGACDACDDALALYLAFGASRQEAAEACGVSPRTVARRLTNARFRRRVEKATALLSRRLLDRLLSFRLVHLERLDSLADPAPSGRPPESSSVRLKASRALLELGFRLRRELEFEERLRTLEENVLRAPAARVTREVSPHVPR